MSLRTLTVVGLLALAPVAARAERIELSTGEVLTAKVLERSAEGAWLEHPALGRLWVRAENLRSIDGGPLVAPAPAAAPAAGGAAAPVAAPEAAPAHPWKFTVELGASGKSGNTDSSDLHAAITAAQETEARRVKGVASYDYGKADGTKNKDRIDAKITHDWLLKDSPWFLFATLRGEWDDFQDWSHRYTAGAGAGRTLVDEADVELRARGGLQAVKEVGTADEDWRPEGSLGLEGEWTMNDRMKLEATTTWFPDFDDTGEYRIESTAGWAVKLTDADNLRLKIGIKNEYDSHREDPFEKNDFQYFVALIYEF